MDAESLESLIFAVAGQLKKTQPAAAPAEEVSPPPPPPPEGAAASDKTEAESTLPPALDFAVSPIAGAASGM